MSITDEARKLSTKLDRKIAAHRANCVLCGHKLAVKDKACGVCGTRRTGKILDSQDECRHAPVTFEAPFCINCGKKL